MLLEITLPLVSHRLCAHILLQIIACWYIKGIFLHLLCQWKCYNGGSLSCFYCFSKQNAREIAVNEIGLCCVTSDNLMHCGEWYLVWTLCFLTKRRPDNTAHWRGQKLSLPCLLPRASGQSVPAFYPPAVLHLFQILKQKRNWLLSNTL